MINPPLLSKFYEDDMEVWISHYLEAAGGAVSRYPGMNASLTETERKTDGLPVLDGLLREFEKIGPKCGVPFDLIPINTKTDTGTT